jgi:hypothetical protein
MNKNISLGNFSKDALLSKLPKSITVTLVILMVVSVILLGLTIYFVISYFGAVNERNDLDKQILQKQQQINAIGGMQNIAALESQLEQAQQDLIDESPFPEEVSTMDVAYSIIEAAKTASISCYQYTAASPVSININTGNYKQNSYSIGSQGAEGTTGERMARIINFLEELEESYDTSKITGLSLTDREEDAEWTFSFTYSIITMPSQ